MKRVLWWASIILVATAGYAAANPVWATPPGHVDLYGSFDGMSETVTDVAGLVLIYVLMHAPYEADGVTGVEFAAPKPNCFTGTWLSDANNFSVVLGNTQTGYSVGFGSCKTGTIHICTMQMFALGTTPECCYWWVTPHPGNANGAIEASDCSFELLTDLTGGATIINFPDGGCPTPTESATWGEIKSLWAGE